MGTFLPASPKIPEAKKGRGPLSVWMTADRSWHPGWHLLEPVDDGHQMVVHPDYSPWILPNWRVSPTPSAAIPSGPESQWVLMSYADPSSEGCQRGVRWGRIRSLGSALPQW
jgi:hypothetical protein